MHRSYTAHVELEDGSYHSFPVIGGSFREAYRAASSRTAPEHALRGVTLDRPNPRDYGDPIVFAIALRDWEERA